MQQIRTIENSITQLLKDLTMRINKTKNIEKIRIEFTKLSCIKER